MGMVGHQMMDAMLIMIPRLRNARNLTNLREINQLFERPHATTPYKEVEQEMLYIESHLRGGETTMQHRSCNTFQVVYIDRYTPQIQCVEKCSKP